jgi:hypothetical protein
VNGHDLTSAFAEIRASAQPPPHALTPPAVIAAGRRTRRRRRAAAGGGLALLVAVSISIGVVNAAPSGEYSPPVQPGSPSPTTMLPPSILPTPVSSEPSIAPTPTP